MKHVLWFKDIHKEDISRVGGKGANLGEMFNAGMPIPEGFCVTAQAYKYFIDSAKLHDFIADILSDLDVEDTQKLQDASEEIHSLIMHAQFPDDLTDEIKKEYKKLDCFVAVRSSATAEDLPTASFAGQQATFLNIKGERDVVHSVKECFASLFTARAIYYREKNKFEHMDVLISVVIQKMVNSDCAGVIFTANPVTNNREEMIIEGSFGLGEAVVSGSVTPDSYIVEKKGPKIKTVYVSEKRFGIFRNAKGENYEKVFKEHEASKQVLDEKQILELAEMALNIEKHYGKPQDIEWAIEGKKVYITQSRPITTLK